MTPGQLDSSNFNSTWAVKFFAESSVSIGMLLYASENEIGCVGYCSGDCVVLSGSASINIASSSSAIELSKEGLTDRCHCNLSSCLPFQNGTIVKLGIQDGAEEPWIALRGAYTIILILWISANSCSNAGVGINSIQASKRALEFNGSSKDL